MKLNFKEAYQVLAKNPHITLLMVIYLLIMVSLLPILFVQKAEISFYFVLFLMFALTSAFFAGWFGMIKACVLSNQDDDTEESLIKRYECFKVDFFASIPCYILSIGFFILMSAGVFYGISILGDYLFGREDEVITQLATVMNSKSALENFLSTLPPETVNRFFKKVLYSYGCYLSYLFLIIYITPSLYFNKTKNPLIAIKNGLLGIIKKPFGTVLFFVLLLIMHGFITTLEAVSIINQVLMFLSLVLRICFIAYAIVLIFLVYEKNFAFDNNNGSDRLGENSSCN